MGPARGPILTPARGSNGGTPTMVPIGPEREKSMAKAAKKQKSIGQPVRLRDLKAARKVLDATNPVEPGKTVVLPDESIDLALEMEEARATAEAANTQVEYCRLKLAELCGSAEVGVIPTLDKEVYRGITSIDAVMIPAREQRECRVRRASSLEV